MKARLIYDLPEDREDYRNTIFASEMKYVITDLDQWLRSQIKYTKLTEDTANAYEAIRDKVREIADDWKVREIIFD